MPRNASKMIAFGISFVVLAGAGMVGVILLLG